MKHTQNFDELIERSTRSHKIFIVVVNELTGIRQIHQTFALYLPEGILLSTNYVIVSHTGMYRPIMKKPYNSIRDLISS